MRGMVALVVAVAAGVPLLVCSSADGLSSELGEARAALAEAAAEGSAGKEGCGVCETAGLGLANAPLIVAPLLGRGVVDVKAEGGGLFEAQKLPLPLLLGCSGVPVGIGKEGEAIGVDDAAVGVRLGAAPVAVASGEAVCAIAVGVGGALRDSAAVCAVLCDKVDPAVGRDEAELSSEGGALVLAAAVTCAVAVAGAVGAPLAVARAEGAAERVAVGLAEGAAVTCAETEDARLAVAAAVELGWAEAEDGAEAPAGALTELQPEGEALRAAEGLGGREAAALRVELPLAPPVCVAVAVGVKMLGEEERVAGSTVGDVQAEASSEADGSAESVGTEEGESVELPPPSPAETLCSAEGDVLPPAEGEKNALLD